MTTPIVTETVRNGSPIGKPNGTRARSSATRER
jgi:hypothetical protein